jgi:hypothetical protein
MPGRKQTKPQGKGRQYCFLPIFLEQVFFHDDSPQQSEPSTCFNFMKIVVK